MQNTSALALLLASALVSTAGLGSTKPCRALPVPTASAFDSCAGLLYHAPSGSSDRYTIRFINQAGADFHLKDVCILLDGAPLFGDNEVRELVTKSGGAWTGKLADVRHTVEIQVTYEPLGALRDAEVTKTYTFVVRAAQEIAASDGAELELTIVDEGGAEPEHRLKLIATLPAKSSQPRCE
jgi:hypothetical protein